MPEETWELNLIYERKGKKQNIRFYETKDKRLVFVLDSFIQFIEEDEKVYHKALTNFAFTNNPDAKNYLILGGGDGLVAREIFDFNPYVYVTLVDYDEEVIDLFMSIPKLIQLNKYSLYNCKVYTEDALEWIPKNQDKKFDVIILDFPDANSPELKKLYEKGFIEQVVKLLNKNGIISIQTHLTITSQIQQILKDLLGNVKITDYETPLFGEGKICSAKKVK